MDEARFGQQGTTSRVWAERGSRPRAVRQTRYKWVYLYASVCPQTGRTHEWLMPHVDTAHMNLFLEVPGYDGEGPDKKNMDILKQCFDRV